MVPTTTSEQTAVFRRRWMVLVLRCHAIKTRGGIENREAVHVAKVGSSALRISLSFSICLSLSLYNW